MSHRHVSVSQSCNLSLTYNTSQKSRFFKPRLEEEDDDDRWFSLSLSLCQFKSDFICFVCLKKLDGVCLDVNSCGVNSGGLRVDNGG
uniref:Uncharacterized protein n=1 Tax=Brassica oleracea var. oleracea TaxID=109376 RepID=A0A0D3E9I4_BRAOL